MGQRFRLRDVDIAGEFELPRPQAVADPFVVEPRWVRLAGDGSTVLAALHGGVGLWDHHSGALRWWHDNADTAWPLDSGQNLLVAEYRERRLVRYAWPAMTVLEELRYPVPECGGGIEALVLSSTQRLAAAWFNSGQGENGYDVYRLDNGPLRRLTHLEHAINPMDLEPMYCMPVFSPDERLLACAPGAGYGQVDWWTPPYENWPTDVGGEEVEIPSRGGLTTFGSLVLHDIDRDTASVHLLQFDLEPNWVPEDPWDDRWRYGAIGLEFRADDQVRLVLPDSTVVDLPLPAPSAVTLPTPARALPHPHG